MQPRISSTETYSESFNWRVLNINLFAIRNDILLVGIVVSTVAKATIIKYILENYYRVVVNHNKRNFLLMSFLFIDTEFVSKKFVIKPAIQRYKSLSFFVRLKDTLKDFREISMRIFQRQ